MITHAYPSITAPWCPFCRHRAVRVVKHFAHGTLACERNHYWHTCPKHHVTVPGYPRSSYQECTCPTEDRRSR